MWPMSQPKGIERGCLARGISGLSNNMTAAVTELHKAAKYASHANHAKNPANQRDDEAYEAYPHNCIGGQTYERYRTSLVQTFNRILPHLAATTPRQLSLIAWSMARLKLTPGSEHFLFAEMLRRASELDTQGISMVMWSFASLSEVTTEPLFNLLAFFASTKLQDMSSQSISNVLWSCAVLEKDLFAPKNNMELQQKESKCISKAEQIQLRRRIFPVVTTAEFRLAGAVQDSMPLMWAVQCRAVVSTAEISDTAKLL